MPSFTSVNPNLTLNGPVVQVRIGFAKPMREALQKSNKEVPIPIQVSALIDTGASITTISTRIAQQLRLIPHGLVKILTAGQPTLTNLYDAYLDMVPSFGGAPVVFDPIRVAEISLVGQINIDCLIGRDILKKGIFLYIAYADMFSFSL